MKVVGMKGRNLVLVVKITTEVFQKLNEMPSSSKWKGRELHVKPIMSNIKYLVDNFDDIEWSDDTQHFYDEHIEKQKKDFELILMKDADQDLPIDYDFKRLPMDHQAKGFVLTRDEINFAYFLDPGTGKTKLTIDVATYLYLKNKIDALVVVAWPNGVHRVWPDHEMEQDCPIEYESLAWGPKRSKKFLNQVSEFCSKDIVGEYERPKFKLISFNAEAFASQKARDFIIEFLTNRRCMLVIDQSASIKNYSAERTKFLIKQCAPLANYRRILEGSPNSEGTEELYSQFMFLDKNIIGHDTITGFKSEFCKIGYFDNIVGYKNQDELRRRIDPYTYRVREAECLDLPERIYKRWFFDLGTKERRIYDQFKQMSLAEFDQGPMDESLTLSESLAMIKSMRLQQIASGWFPNLEEDPNTGRNVLVDYKQIEKKPLSVRVLARAD